MFIEAPKIDHAPDESDERPFAPLGIPFVISCVAATQESHFESPAEDIDYIEVIQEPTFDHAADESLRPQLGHRDSARVPSAEESHFQPPAEDIVDTVVSDAPKLGHAPMRVRGHHRVTILFVYAMHPRRSRISNHNLRTSPIALSLRSRSSIMMSFRALKMATTSLLHPWRTRMKAQWELIRNSMFLSSRFFLRRPWALMTSELGE